MELCNCDPAGSGEEHCNGGCELRDIRALHDERHLAMGESRCWLFNCPDGRWLALIDRLLAAR